MGLNAIIWKFWRCQPLRGWKSLSDWWWSRSMAQQRTIDLSVDYVKCCGTSLNCPWFLETFHVDSNLLLPSLINFILDTVCSPTRVQPKKEVMLRNKSGLRGFSEHWLESVIDKTLSFPRSLLNNTWWTFICRWLQHVSWFHPLTQRSCLLRLLGWSPSREGKTLPGPRTDEMMLRASTVTTDSGWIMVLDNTGKTVDTSLLHIKCPRTLIATGNYHAMIIWADLKCNIKTFLQYPVAWYDDCSKAVNMASPHRALSLSLS